MTMLSSRYFQTSHLSFFNDTTTTEIYTLSLHDALPISISDRILDGGAGWRRPWSHFRRAAGETGLLDFAAAERRAVLVRAGRFAGGAECRAVLRNVSGVEGGAARPSGRAAIGIEGCEQWRRS